MITLATCSVCFDDFDQDSMIEDINNWAYCLVCSGDICPVCGIYAHDCEGEL